MASRFSEDTPDTSPVSNDTSISDATPPATPPKTQETQNATQDQVQPQAAGGQAVIQLPHVSLADMRARTRARWKSAWQSDDGSLLWALGLLWDWTKVTARALSHAISDRSDRVRQAVNKEVGDSLDHGIKD